MMLIDYHTHHARCGHAKGSLEEYVQQGIERGIAQLGLSDHMPLIHVDPATYYPEMAMPMEELPRYVEEVLELKSKYSSQIDIRLGLEGDYIEGYEEHIESIIKAYPWDYVIGSVHFLGEWDISDFRQVHEWNGKDVYAQYVRYYDAVSKAAKTGFYDIMGHLDVIKRFEYLPTEEQGEDWIKLELATLQSIADSGVAIELNASGLSKPCKEMFPSRRILEQAYNLGIPMTVGSDAHDPTHVFQNIDQALQLLSDIGVQELATFSNRKRSMIPLVTK